MGKQDRLKKIVESKLPTEWGTYLMSVYAKDENNPIPHIVLKHPDIDISKVVDVRVHSECITGDLFHSQRCDCGEQLHKSMEHISKTKGMLIYLRQEGRGIGIINKLRAYNKQDEGMDTADANVALGFDVDLRDFSIAADILVNEGVTTINLLTNNPEKIKIISSNDITIENRVPIEIPPNADNKKYLSTKKERMGHLLNHINL